jgi:hypothetical protein
LSHALLGLCLSPAADAERAGGGTWRDVSEC